MYIYLLHTNLMMITLLGLLSTKIGSYRDPFARVGRK